MITLKIVIDQIAEVYDRLQAPVSGVGEILRQSEKKIQELLGILEELDIRSPSLRLRKWAAVKAALRKDKIAKFNASLEPIKASPLLAQSLLSR
jgi:hypothetical protein